MRQPFAYRVVRHDLRVPFSRWQGSRFGWRKGPTVLGFPLARSRRQPTPERQVRTPRLFQTLDGPFILAFHVHAVSVVYAEILAVDDLQPPVLTHQIGMGEAVVGADEDDGKLGLSSARLRASVLAISMKFMIGPRHGLSEVFIRACSS